MAIAMMRPPSSEDVRLAQSHLVLLKSKMRQRRLAAAEATGASADPRMRGRFERVPHANNSSDDAGTTSQAPLHGGPGRPREARPPRGLENSPRTVGVTWDPPSTVVENQGRRPEEGYPPSGGFQGSGFPQSPGMDGGAGMDEFPQEEDDGIPLVPCPDCGRKFKEDRIDKHMKSCKKVFSQKRKPFSSAANRLGDLENAGELIANAQKIDKEKEAPKVAAKEEKKDDKKVPEWKKKSLEFRAAMLAAKGATGDAEAQAKAQELQEELKAAVGDAVPAGMLKCPHCGRTFKQEAGERHILICLKTFGGKNGGGLKKGGGRSAGASKPGEPAPVPTDASRGGAARMSSVGGGAAVRKPSTHRSRTQGETPPPGTRVPPGR